MQTVNAAKCPVPECGWEAGHNYGPVLANQDMVSHYLAHIALSLSLAHPTTYKAPEPLHDVKVDGKGVPVVQKVKPLPQ